MKAIIYSLSEYPIMKLFLLTTFGIALTSISFAEEDKTYLLDIKVRVYPEEIRYADPCFLTFSVTNQGQETLELPYGKTFSHFINGKLLLGEKVLQFFHDPDHVDGVNRVVEYPFYFRSVKPGETMEFHLRIICLPLPDSANAEGAKELLRQVNKDGRDYEMSFSVPYRSRILFFTDDRPSFPKDFPMSIIDEPQCAIRILPRPEEEIKMIKDWYSEERSLADVWTKEQVRRTNELATLILERAKQPNSTISQNLAEFVQLRGFLVDMCYAENAESEKATFGKLVKFVENAKDKELWIKFLDEFGFWSIVKYTDFKPEKVQQYRKLFAEHFAKDFNKIGWAVRP